MNRSKDHILKALHSHAEQIRRLGAQSLALFGSTARGEAAAGSDLDFLVELSPKTFDTYMDVKFYLEDLFGTPVDLVLRESVKPVLRETILGEAVHAEGL
ncbi:MAG: nucleotidyltransferase family protein [Chrysiogenetes bacterium]|nr:nucleotidyltransferase family protein [Chrysiogenetes bacterium]